jgi:nitrate reductase gamma subunit
MNRQRYIASLWLFLALILLWGAAGQAEANISLDEEAASCLECHASQDPESWQQELGPHAELACQECHQGADTYPHESLSLASCQECHNPHNEEVTGDMHAGIACSACHLANMRPFRPTPGGPVKALAPPDLRGGPSLHRLVAAPAPASCRRCHHAGNQAGASAMVLPPKSALCLACHTATLSVTDWPSRIALGLLAFGLLGSLGFWFSGGNQGPTSSHGRGHGLRWSSILVAFFLDGLLQRRLWRHSPGRGLIHALIFWPFVLRFVWGLAALVLEKFWPQIPITQAMLNKNHPAQALFFDLTGLMILAGVAAAMLRRLAGRNKLPSGLPGPDWLSLGLLGGALLLGFVLEGARLAMTGWPAGGSWATAGWALSFLFKPGASLQEAYGYLWYAHVLAWCGFVAYLPFGRMFHLITAPLVLALRGADAH